MIELKNAYFVRDLTDSKPKWFIKQIYNLIINGTWEKNVMRFEISIPAERLH